MCSIDDERYPITDKFVRMVLFKYSVVSQLGDELLFEDIANFSMGGYIPTSLMNMVLGSMMA